MNSATPGGEGILDNPYTYTDFKLHATREARGTIFGEPIGTDG